MNNNNEQQRIGMLVNVFLLVIAAAFLFKFCGKSKDEKLTSCFVKEMKGQGEYMRDAVILKCKQQTGYKG